MAPKLLGLLIFCGVAMVFASVAVNSVRQWRPWGLTIPGGDRSNTPVLFWAYVGACAAIAVLALGGAVAFALQPI
jgi:hypothetical protein